MLVDFNTNETGKRKMIIVRDIKNNTFQYIKIHYQSIYSVYIHVHISGVNIKCYINYLYTADLSTPGQVS